MPSCLGPYTITTPNLIESEGFFVDNNKTRLVAVIQDCNSIEQKPSDDAILLNEENNCNSCIIRWYECPSDMGRTYSFEISGCDIRITNFENGFLYQDPCDAFHFGSDQFCFGKVYSESGSQPGNTCESIFIFDERTFKVSGMPSESDLFECPTCEEIMTFGADPSVNDIQPDAPNEAVDAADSINENNEASDNDMTLSSAEDRTNWPTPSDWSSPFTDVSCSESTRLTKEDCDSYDNPDIAVLRSGQAIVAYTDRNEDGKTKISLAIFGSSVENKIIYHRKLSKGILLNEKSLRFEIFDEILIDNNAGTPSSPTYIGFLNGPLKGGQVFQITNITRTTDDNSRPKNTITFNNSGREAIFTDSNHASGISWFIISGSESNPTDINLLDLPVHKKDNVQVPVDMPSITVAENNLMTGEDQHIFVTYQAFEDNIWKTYLTQIRLSEKQDSNPKYISPYLFSNPTEVSSGVLQNGITLLKYKVKELDSISNPNELRVLFEVLTENDKQVFDCDLGTSGYITSLGFVISDANGLSPTNAWVECAYNIPCGGSALPDWTIGTEYTGGILPDASELGWSGDSACITNISGYPNDTSNWCYNKASCTQYSLIDDPYCPDAYDDIVNLEYKPEDLYVLKDGDNLVTRVKYHMSASVTGLTEASSADIMFVVDYSGSMGSYIDNTRNAVPLLAQLLQQRGIDVRFGLTVFGSNDIPSNTPIPTNYYVCGTGGDRLFNGLSPSIGNCQCSEGGTLPDEAEGGFTDNVNLLTKALCCWAVTGGSEPHWVATQFASGSDINGDSSPFEWRENARKFIIMITDEPPSELNAPPNGNCLGLNEDKDDAISVLINNDITFIPIVSPVYESSYSDIPSQTGWTGSSYFDINSETYDEIFVEISKNIETITSGLRILERDSSGYDPTFIKNAEILVSYSGDLSDLWTFNKKNFVFSDSAPTSTGNLKGLSNFPYSIYENKIYDVDSVHIIGNISNWIYYRSSGDLRFDYPDLGSLSSSRTSPEYLFNGIRSTVKTNNRNEVFIAYETIEHGYNQISIIGTGDFCQNSITGAKANRLTKFVSANDFVFKHDITLPTEGVNQLCDLVIDNSDVIHITWQSNRDDYWEIYYANSQNIFDPVRVTESKSRSGYPKIDIDSTGVVFVVYHDNRFGPYDIMLSYKNSNRVITLLEQDAYVASQRDNFLHYTNTLPILVRNKTITTPFPGKFVFSKSASEDGNNNENYIFLVDKNGNPVRGGDTIYEIISMAGNTDGYLYGITTDSKLLQLDVPEFEDPYLDIETDEITEIGDIDFSTPVEGVLRFEDTFTRNNNTPFPTSSWLQQTTTVIGLNSANGFICSDNVNICGTCPPVNNCNDSYIGHYLHRTRLVQEDRNLSIKSRVKWLNPDNDSTLTGPIYSVYLRGQPTANDNPAPSYQVSLSHSSNVTRVVVYRNISTLSRVTIDSTAFSSTENIWLNRWVDLKVDCYDSGSDVKFDIYLDGVLRFSAIDDGTTVAGTPLKTHSSGAFSYGFSLQSVETSGGSGEYHTAQVDNFSVTTLSQTLEGSVVLDSAHDNSGVLWALISNTDSNNNVEQRAIQISKTTAQTSFSGVTREAITRNSGGLAIDHNGKFYVISYFEGKSELKSSPYPKLSNNVIVFDFTIINNDLDVNFVALTVDSSNNLFGLDENNSVYSINTDNGNTTLLYDLTSSPYEDPYVGPNPISTISGFATLYTGLYNKTSESGFFHILLEFYDNLNQNGDPFLSIDSRDNLEAFIIDEREDSYIEDAYFSGAKGVFLEENETAFVFFDASHFTPNSNYLAYPYRLETNQAYFPKAYLINESGEIIQENLQQRSSYSCSKCSTFSNNLFDQHGCSFSFTAENTGTNKTYKFMIDFFADQERKHQIQRYIMTANSPDIGLFEINNKPASTVSDMINEGLIIDGSGKPFIQIYPSLDPETGIICGVKYYVSVYICEGGDCNIPNANPENLTIEYEDVFLCECSSKIFDNRIENLYNIDRWISSSNGYSDTRITDTPKNSTNPNIATRSTDAAVITFVEDGQIKAATFNKIEDTNIFGSGTRSWFDYSTGSFGQDISMDLDLYDRAVMSYEVPDYPSGRGISKTELPTNNIENKICDFINEEIQPNIDQTCDISSITDNIITSDPFISSQVVKKILIKNPLHYTYNASGTLTPVIEDCNVILQIWGTPESIAIRFKNENQTEYSGWCPFEPELSNYYLEKEWKISGGSGSKEICVQVMTYNGVTTQFCLPVIADYQKTIYQIGLYSDSAHTIPLLTYEDLFVATTKNKDGLSDETKEVWVEIIPSRDLGVEAINFDVIQQGPADQINLVAIKTTNSDGVIVYKGKFDVILEDKILNIDGLAQIKPKFPTICDRDDPFSNDNNNFIKSEFNLLESPSEVSQGSSDSFESSRQTTTGRIGVDVVIRPNEDPFLIFGDPDFYTKINIPTVMNLPSGAGFGITEADTGSNNNTNSSGSSGSGGSGSTSSTGTGDSASNSSSGSGGSATNDGSSSGQTDNTPIEEGEEELLAGG